MIELNIYEVLDLFVDGGEQKFSIYDYGKQEEIYKGYLSDMPEHFGNATVLSIDNLENDGVITFNVEIKG